MIELNGSQAQTSSCSVEELEERLAGLVTQKEKIVVAVEIVMARQHGGVLTVAERDQVGDVLRLGIPVMCKEGHAFTTAATPPAHFGNALIHLVVGLAEVEQRGIDIAKLGPIARNESADQKTRSDASRPLAKARRLYEVLYLTCAAAAAKLTDGIETCEQELALARLSPAERATQEQQAEAAKAALEAAKAAQAERDRFMAGFFHMEPVEIIVVPVNAPKGAPPVKAKVSMPASQRLVNSMDKKVFEFLNGRKLGELPEDEQIELVNAACRDGLRWGFGKLGNELTDTQFGEGVLTILTRSLESVKADIEIKDEEREALKERALEILALAKAPSAKIADAPEPAPKSERTDATWVAKVVKGNRTGRHPDYQKENLDPELSVGLALASLLHRNGYNAEVLTVEVIKAAREALVATDVTADMAHKAVEAVIATLKERAKAKHAPQQGRPQNDNRASKPGQASLKELGDRDTTVDTAPSATLTAPMMSIAGKKDGKVRKGIKALKNAQPADAPSADATLAAN